MGANPTLPSYFASLEKQMRYIGFMILSIVWSFMISCAVVGLVLADPNDKDNFALLVFICVMVIIFGGVNLLWIMFDGLIGEFKDKK